MQRFFRKQCRRSKWFLALLLCVVMVVSLIPMTALAAGENEPLSLPRPREITVTYMASDGKGTSYGTQNAGNDGRITIRGANDFSPALSNGEAVLLGWSSEKNDKTAEYEAGTAVSFKRSKTLYAVWSDSSGSEPDGSWTDYKVNYKLFGGLSGRTISQLSNAEYAKQKGSGTNALTVTLNDTAKTSIADGGNQRNAGTTNGVTALDVWKNGLVITPPTGYYVEQVILCCNDEGGFNCNTAESGGLVEFGEKAAASTAYTITAAEIQAADEASTSKAVFHEGRGTPLHIMIKLGVSPNPVYIVYDAGTAGTTDVNGILTGVVHEDISAPDGSEEYNNGNAYKYTYSGSSIPVHTVLDIAQKTISVGTDTYAFAGWAVQYYSAASENSAGDEISLSGYVSTGSNVSKDTLLTLDVHVKLVAQWILKTDIDDGKGELTISGRKIWDDGQDVNSRPSELEICLLADGATVDTVTTTAEKDWTYSFNISERPLKKADGTDIVYTVGEGTVSGYEEDVSRHIDPDINFTAPSSGEGWSKILPCSSLTIPVFPAGDAVIAAKLATNGSVIVWSETALTQAERDVIESSLKTHASGIGSPDSFVFVSGAGEYKDYFKATATAITFADTEDWSLLWTGSCIKDYTHTTDSQIVNRKSDLPSPDPTYSIRLTINKTVEKAGQNNPAGDKKFNFVLADGTGENAAIYGNYDITVNGTGAGTAEVTIDSLKEIPEVLYLWEKDEAVPGDGWNYDTVKYAVVFGEPQADSNVLSAVFYRLDKDGGFDTEKDTPAASLSFTNTYTRNNGAGGGTTDPDPHGSVKITKTVTGSQVPKESIAYEFMVWVQNASGTAVSEYVSYQITAADGTAAGSGSTIIGTAGYIFSLKDGESILFSNIAGGNRIQVKEITTGAFTTAVSGLTDGICIISPNTTKSVEFNNHYGNTASDPSDNPSSDPSGDPADNPVKPAAPDGKLDDVPQTGSEAGMGLWISLACLSLAGMMITRIIGKRFRYGRL